MGESVLGFARRMLTQAETNYCVMLRELLAIIFGVRMYRAYLAGVQFTIRTDHSALCWLLDTKDLEGQMPCWIQELGMYDFVVEHHPGKKHSNLDEMSRGLCR